MTASVTRPPLWPARVVPVGREQRIGRHSIRYVPPNIRDPRIHLAAFIATILFIGVGWLGFRLSVAQILVTIVACATVEIAITYRRTAVLVWPASAFQTATSTALLFRVIGTEHGDYWTLRGWHLFVIVGVAGVLTKYAIRFRSGHVFNPSNVVPGAGVPHPRQPARRAARLLVGAGQLADDRRVRRHHDRRAGDLRAPQVARPRGGDVGLAGVRTGDPGRQRSFDHDEVLADTDLRDAFLVDRHDLARDLDLHVLHDHRPAHGARGPSRAHLLRHGHRPHVGAVHRPVGNRVRREGGIAVGSGGHLRDSAAVRPVPSGSSGSAEDDPVRVVRSSARRASTSHLGPRSHWAPWSC